MRNNDGSRVNVKLNDKLHEEIEIFNHLRSHITSSEWMS